MERVRRRFWTWAVSAVAVVVISGAMISGLFQLAVLALPSYREDLSAWVTNVAGRPVQIGGVSLVWRGFAPRLDLSDITLFTPDNEEALSAERLTLGFGLLRLVQGDVSPSRIELSGLSLAVDVDAEGKISIAGFDALRDAARPREEWLREFMRFSSVRLENCEVRLTHAKFGGTPLRFTLVHGEVDHSGTSFDVDGDLRLPMQYGDTASFSADFDGEIDRPESWSGDFSFEAAKIAPQAWLIQWLAPGARIEAQELALNLEGELSEGQPTHVSATLRSGALSMQRVGHSVEAQSARLDVVLAPAGEGWQLSIERLRFDDEDQLHGSLRYAPAANGGYQIDAEADLLRLTRLAPWLGLWRDVPEGVLAAARTGGDVKGLVLRVHQTPAGRQYSLRAALSGASLRADRHIGFSGLSGELFANEVGGRFEFGDTPLRVQLPSAFSSELPVETLSGVAEWKRATDGWQVVMNKFGWSAAATQGSGTLRLMLPDDRARSPELNLTAGFSADEVGAIKAFMPSVWGEGLRAWLQRAIKSGRVPRGQLAIRGPLADFPFHQRKTGEWKLDLDATKVRLDYVPGWPVIDDISAHLHFEGNGLLIQASGANLLGNRIDSAVASFADFHDAVLTIDGKTSGETARYYNFLRASPLRKQLAGLVNNSSASGPARVQVHLDIPLHKSTDTQVRGTVALDGVEMFYKGLDQPLSAITGELAYSNTGVVAEQLRAQFAEVPVAVRIEPRDGTAGVILAQFPFAPKTSGEGASAYVPAFLRSQLAGASAWTAELAIAHAGESALVLASDLVGTELRMPAPIGKSAPEARAIRVSIGSDAQAPVRVKVGYATTLGADIALKNRGEGQGWTASAVNIRLGAGEAAPADGEGIRIGGVITDFDLPAWIGAMPSVEPGAGLALRGAEIEAQRVMFGKQAIGPTRISYAPTAKGWRSSFDGPGAGGELVFDAAAGGALSGRFDHLALEVEGMSDKPVAGDPAPAAEPSDPGSWPALDVSCDHLVVGGTDLGRAQLRASRIAGGLKLEQFNVSGGKLDMSANGQWRRAEDRSTAELAFDLASSDVAAVLRGFKYAPNLTAKSSHFSGALSWSPSAEGVAWEQAAGRITLRVENGAMKAVEPGAGRVLGLINFYALPRRLTLDFRDVVNEGLSFDTITGNFELGGGAANTQDLKIEAPSLRMEMRGRVGLVARDYDQRVTVYPDISAGVTLGAALLGGPALGALVLLAQEILDKPLDQATQLSYRLTGTWDNPKVERIGNESKKPG